MNVEAVVQSFSCIKFIFVHGFPSLDYHRQLFTARLIATALCGAILY